MRDLQHLHVGLYAGKKNKPKLNPIGCEFEITFRCGLRCRHCYSDCYNQPDYIREELKTDQIKAILDKLQSLEVLMLTLTGGDPLARADFLEIYSYALRKGFIITLFTNAYSMDEKTAGFLAAHRPRAIEITLNAASRRSYEAISRVKGSFEKAIAGLNRMQAHRLPLKIKVLAMSQNYRELHKIENFLRSRKLKFNLGSLIHASLDRSKEPCGLRISPEKAASLDALSSTKPEDDPIIYFHDRRASAKKQIIQEGSPDKRIFSCKVGSGDYIYLDPYGMMFPCHSIRKPALNFLKSSPASIKWTRFNTFARIGRAEFRTRSKCASCHLREICSACPGTRLLETGNFEKPVSYFCRLASIAAGRNN